MPNVSKAKRTDNEARDNRRLDRQDELREKLQGLEYLNQIEKSVEALRRIGNHLKRNQKKMESAELATIKARISVIKLSAEINFRRLAKLLPDLRATLIQDEDGNNPLNGLMDAIIKNQDKGK